MSTTKEQAGTHNEQETPAKKLTKKATKKASKKTSTPNDYTIKQIKKLEEDLDKAKDDNKTFKKEIKQCVKETRAMEEQRDAAFRAGETLAGTNHLLEKNNRVLLEEVLLFKNIVKKLTDK